MLQDYLYLRDYVKIFAAIIQKADDFEQIRFLSTQLSDTIGETYRTHLPYMRRLGVTDAEIDAARPHIDNSAYTHYMICEAQAGDVLTFYLVGEAITLPADGAYTKSGAEQDVPVASAVYVTKNK